MRKTDKKIDNNIRAVLMKVCNIALDEYSGFKWLTHFVNYSSFPASLSIVCIFDKNMDLLEITKNGNDERLRKLIKEKLASIDIRLHDVHKHITFDTEESCDIDNNGNWNERFK